MTDPTVRRSTTQPHDRRTLSLESHRDEARERIRQAIRSGTIRVRPWPGCPDRVRVFSSTAEGA